LAQGSFSHLSGWFGLLPEFVGVAHNPHLAQISLPQYAPRPHEERSALSLTSGRRFGIGPVAMKIAPIIPVAKREVIESPKWVYELKLDGFRGIADTINGRMLSKNLNSLKRFQHLLDDLPLACVFDGEICVFDETDKPDFNALLFGRRKPVYIVFDLLFYEGEDIRHLSLQKRRGILDQVAERYGLQKSELFFGCGKLLFQAVCSRDLEGIVVKKLDDAYDAGRTKWWKILNMGYSQKEGRGELFEKGRLTTP
jgi:ATP-dependent DNA ligase